MSVPSEMPTDQLSPALAALAPAGGHRIAAAKPSSDSPDTAQPGVVTRKYVDGLWAELPAISRNFALLDRLEVAVRSGVPFTIDSAEDREEFASYLSWQFMHWVPGNLEDRPEEFRELCLDSVETTECLLADVSTIPEAHRGRWLTLIGWARCNDPFTPAAVRHQAEVAEAEYWKQRVA